MSGGGHTESGGGLRKLIIVLVLVVAVVIFHRFGVRTTGFDPSAMLALGFVILVSYVFGQLVERLGLPHITGYLIAGLALGPSAAEFLPEGVRIAPFDAGLLSNSVIEQLVPLNTLAVALIALTAGGELKLSGLRRGLAGILGVLTGQVVAIVGLSIAFVVALSGVIPVVQLPGLGVLDLSTAVALGAVLGCISIATSPAATIAVINDVGARGPTTSNILATVVLKDVVVVVLFAVVSTLAAQTMGLGGTDQRLGLYLLKHIGGALALGAVIGFGMALYLRYVKREALLFLVGIVYTAAFVATKLDVEAVVLFITAGFVAANFSSEGDHLLERVETLSLPVYVVFFTLAGARLHLDQLGDVAGFAVGLCLLRAFGIWVGTELGGRLGGAPLPVRRWGWLGFVSQAGVAISLAAIVGERMGPAGESLSTLIIAGIALNEIGGPVLLKVGLTRVGETAAEREAEGEVGDDEPASELAPESLAEWPTPERGGDVWGPPLASGSRELNELVRDLQLDLADVTRLVADEPLAIFRDDALSTVRELRREFLRHHRRVTVEVTHESALSAAEALRLQQAELAEKWRASVLARGAKLRQVPGWDPSPILAAVESVAEGLPETLALPLLPESVAPRDYDPPLVALKRWQLRTAGYLGRLASGLPQQRVVPLRVLARYHLWGSLPEQLEPVAALYAQAENHLVSRVRSIFDGVVIAYDELADEVEAERRASLVRREAPGGEEEGPPVREEAPLSLDRELARLRAQIDEDLELAAEEVQRIADDLALRTGMAIGRCLRSFKEDLPLIATPDLPVRRRAASAVFRRRDEQLSWLRRGSESARATSSALYNRLALEMELLALEGRIKDVLDEHATGLGRDVRGRGHLQVARVREAVQLAREDLERALTEESEREALVQRLRVLTDPVARIGAEASRSAALLRDQLLDEGAVTPVLDALNRAAQGLTDHYEVPAGLLPKAEHRLPPATPIVDVPFRDWVLARIETSLAPRLLSSTREVARRVEPLAHSLLELERRIAFNVELAVNELSVVEDEAVGADVKRLVREMIGGTLARNQELFAGYASASATWGEDVRESVRDAVLIGLDELRGGLVDGKVGRLHSQIARDVRGRRISRIAEQLRASLGRSWVIVRRALAEAVGEERLDRTRRALGWPYAQPDEATATPTGGFEPPPTATAIPMVYRRLFSAQALEAGDILTGRDAALSRALALLEEGGAHTLRTVAVVGPDGVGKGAFVNAVLRSKRWPKVREMHLAEPATVEQIADFLDGAGEGQLFVVTGMHWMRSLAPGGLEPLRRFVAGVVADGGKNAFLVRSDSLVWAQALEFAPLSDAFPEVIDLDPLDEEALQAAVLARHTVSGYGLVFSQGLAPQSRLEELVLQATNPLSRPRQSYFRALHAASGGLLRDALRLWLASVAEVDDAQDFVHLGPVPTPSIFALRGLHRDDVLTLYQVARQGWMTAEICAALFRIGHAEAEARLLALAHTGVLHREGPLAAYRVAPHLRGAARRLLLERGFIS